MRFCYIFLIFPGGCESYAMPTLFSRSVLTEMVKNILNIDSYLCIQNVSFKGFTCKTDVLCVIRPYGQSCQITCQGTVTDTPTLTSEYLLKLNTLIESLSLQVLVFVIRKQALKLYRYSLYNQNEAIKLTQQK